MATHDYILANASGAAFRTDLNNALAAIVSNNSNSSEPATMYAYQWWADTSNAVMKIRNSANNAWIELFQLDGTLTLEDGAVGTPALAFRDDLNTGIYSSAADTFNIATGGVERMELGATTIFNEDGADVDFRIEGDTEANLFYVDAGNDRIGIGVSTPAVLTHIYDSTDTSSVTEQLRISGGDRSADSFETGFRFFTQSPSSNGNRHYRITANGNTGLSIQGYETSTGNAAADRDIFLCPDGGDVGIGQSSVGAKLHVSNPANQLNVIVSTTDTFTGNASLFSFRAVSSEGGFISLTNNGTTCAYGTSSDYRLKENATTISDGITRLKTLKPYRFNFKAAPDTTVDGFFAHELTAVPEAVVGEKDAMQEIKYTKEDELPEGKNVGDFKEYSTTEIKPQGVDYSKLTPLLTAALQEAITKIETLETKVAALEAA